MPVTTGDDTISFTPNLNIIGNYGNDTYLFGRTSGTMEVRENGAYNPYYSYLVPDPMDVVQFDADVLPADAIFTRQNGSLIVSIQNSPAQLIFRDFFQGGLDPQTQLPYTVIEEFRFADGTVIRGDTLLTLTSPDTTGYIHGTSGNDSLVATGLYGHTIFGKEGNDTLSGAHPEQDYLYGGAGDDVYQVDPSVNGDPDVIGQPDGTATEAGYDVLEIQGNLTSADINLVRKYDGFYIYADTQLLASVNFNGYENGNSSLEAIRFSNGEVLTLQDIKRLLLTPGSGNDVIYGFVTSDVIDGGLGNDVLRDELGGDDVYLGGGGSDTLYAGAGSDTLDGGEGNDSLWGAQADDTIVLGRNSGNDTLSSSSGVIQLAQDVTASDVLLSRTNIGNLSIRIVGTTAELHVYQFNFVSQVNDPNAGLKIRFANGQEWDANAIRQQVTLIATDGDDLLSTPTNAATTLAGGSGNDKLSGNATSTILGGEGNDTISGGALVDPGAGNDLVNTLVGTLLFGRGFGQDTLTSTSKSQVTVQFGANVLPDDIDVVAAAGGFTAGAIFRIRGTTDALTLTTVTQSNGALVIMRFANGQIWTAEEVFRKAEASHSTQGDDLLSAVGQSAGKNFHLVGLGGNDTLVASSSGDGGDTLDGGTGDDLLRGSYRATTVYVFGRGYGNDTIESGTDAAAVNLIQLADDIDQEDVTLEKVGSDLLIHIVGTDDTLRLKNFTPATAWPPRSDWQIEFGTGERWSRNAIDALVTPVEPPPPATGIFVTTTNNFASTLTGGVGNDTLLGFRGNDTLIGGKGNDLLRGGVAHDTYHFELGDGHDTVRPDQTSYNLYGEYDAIRFGQGIGVNDVVLEKSGGDLVLRYNNGTDSVTIENFIDRVDMYPVRPFSQVQFASGEIWAEATVRERAAWLPMTEGDDYWLAAGSKTSVQGLGGNDTLLGDVATNSLYGNAGHDLLLGGAGNDTLDGGEGNDTLEGGNDQDTYAFGVGYGQDRIIEGNFGTADTIRLGAGILPTQVQLRWVGRDLVLSITGQPDTLTVESYFTDTAFTSEIPAKIEAIQFANGTVWNAATITSRATANNAGNDYFVSRVNVSGAAGDDTLVGHNVAIELNGGAGNDVLTGGTGDDTLKGGTGNDRLNGENGQDLYVFGLGDGQDTVMAQTNTGTAAPDALRLGVNAADVTLRRDSYNLYIDLPGGTDTLTFDSFFKRKGSLSQITFANGEVWNAAAILAALPGGTAEAELLQGELLNGNEGNDTLLGLDGSSNDTLNGGPGWDSMVGGAGNDAYTVDSTKLESGAWVNDIVVELADSGYDTVTTNVSGYVLPANVEYMVMTGKGEAMLSKDGTMRAYGNELHNRITGRAGADLMFGMAGQDTLDGGAGNDTLDGGEGRDSLVGGDGDDYYVVDRSDTDVVVEQDRAVNPNAGIDWVETRNNGYQLPDHIENLRLLAAPLGFGNGLFNIMEGSDADNHFRGFAGDDTLRGLGGNDTLEGGAGNDQLEGGEGDDTYLWGAMHGADVVQDTAGANDVIQLEAGVSAEQLWFQQSGNDLVMRLIGTADQILIKDWYTSPDNQIERVLLADGRDLQSSQVQALVDAMSSLPPPAQTTLPADTSHAAIAQLIAASWA